LARAAGWLPPTAEGSVIVETLLSTLLILFFAEFLPKSIVRGNPNFYYRIFAPLHLLFYVVLYPIVWFTDSFIHVVLRLCGCRMQHYEHVPQFDRVDLENLIATTPERADQEDSELKLFQNALEFADLRVRDCMVPRVDVEGVELSSSVEQLTERFVESKYSRIFVWEGSIDNIVGYVNSKSLFRQPKTLRSVLMKVHFVAETLPMQTLLEHFIKHRCSIAVVVDEFGGTAGIISLEDVLEQIFGEIEDEHDEHDMVEKRVGENEYLFSCRVEIKYLNEHYHLAIEESRDYDTLAGYIISHLGDIPSPGQVLTIDGLEIHIVRATRSRIELARVKRL
jgi:CBS domain containing-hemolysin-like protein